MVTDICLEEYIAELDALDKKLRSGECLTSEDQGVINEFTVYGSLMFRRREENDGSCTVGRHFELAVDDLNRIEQEGVAIALLIPPAYDLGEKWVESQTWPRYEAICRAPTCGRCFYSGHRDAKNCPPANNGDACRLEWIRYRRWLEKQRLDAETTWADQTLQQQFSEQDEVRTEIRDEQISRAHGIGVR
ncbi:MAG: hypothetical protein IID41_13335 [Planctomycetes bacterium]|nr:hypothetical protein [Planctomycetota bacterium]